MRNPNANDEFKWWMLLGDHCSFLTVWPLLICSGSMHEGISSPIKHSHSDWSLHSASHFVIDAVRVRIQMHGNTTMLILCFRFFVAFAFVIHIRTMHKWNLSLIKQHETEINKLDLLKVRMQWNNQSQYQIFFPAEDEQTLNPTHYWPLTVGLGGWTKTAIH